VFHDLDRNVAASSRFDFLADRDAVSPIAEMDDSEQDALLQLAKRFLSHRPLRCIIWPSLQD
jgi:hypothetical protein